MDARRRARALVADQQTLADLAELGRLQCTIEETAHGLNTTVAKLTRFLTRNVTARDVFNDNQAHGMAALRRAQFKLAETNASMAMFLAKLILEQTDRREVDPSGAKDVSENLEYVRAKIARLIAAAEEDEGEEGAGTAPGGAR